VLAKHRVGAPIA